MDNTTRNEILKLLAEGKISASEAIDLLDKATGKAVEESSPAEAVYELKADEILKQSAGEDFIVEDLKTTSGKPEVFESIQITEDDILPNGKNPRPHWLKIRVSELDSGRNRVNITLPLSIVSFGLGVARRFGANIGEVNQADEIWQMIKDGERGVLVDVEDEEDNEHVQILLD